MHIGRMCILLLNGTFYKCPLNPFGTKNKQGSLDKHRVVRQSRAWARLLDLVYLLHETSLSSLRKVLVLRNAHSVKENRKHRNVLKQRNKKGTWVAQLVDCPTLAQVMILGCVSLSPTTGFTLTA